MRTEDGKLCILDHGMVSTDTKCFQPSDFTTF